MKQNHNTLRSEMQEELELKAVPQAVENKLRQVYAELPDRLPARRKGMPGWARNTLVTASSLAAAFVVLVGVNGANPAFAESLPFVGGIFQNINNRGYIPSQNLADTQQRIGDMSTDVADAANTITVPAGGLLEKAANVTLKEVYYDGSFVFAGVEFQVDSDSSRVHDLWGENYNVRINGEDQILHEEDGTLSYPSETGNGFVDMSSYFWDCVDRGHYIMQRAFRVPDALQGADSLEVSLCFDGVDSDDKGVLNSTDFTLDFTARKTPVQPRSADCQGIEQGGVKLLSAYTTPAGISIEVEYPDSYVNPACCATFEDGLSIGSYGSIEREQDGAWKLVDVYAGLKEGESRKVVWWLFDKNGSSQYEAVFLIDFENGTVELGSEEDVKAAPVFDYACGVEAVQALGEHEYAVEKLHLSQSKPLLYLMTGEGRKDLRVELWQDGKRVRTAYTENSSWAPDADYWEYYNLKSGAAMTLDDMRYAGTEHGMYMFLLDDLYVTLDPTAPVTVKVYEKDSGGLLLEEEIQLTQSELHDEP